MIFIFFLSYRCIIWLEAEAQFVLDGFLLFEESLVYCCMCIIWLEASCVPSLQVTVVWGQPGHHECLLPKGRWSGVEPRCCDPLHYFHTTPKWLLCWCADSPLPTEPLHCVPSPQKFHLVLCLSWWVKDYWESYLRSHSSRGYKAPVMCDSRFGRIFHQHSQHSC